MSRRVEVKVVRFFELEDDVKPGGDIEWHTIEDFIRGFAMRAGEKLVKEHNFKQEQIGEVLDLVLRYERTRDSRKPSDILRETIGGETAADA